MDVSMFEALGPVMIGPSSSHTAGAARLSRVAARAVQGEFDRVDFILHGSFAKTYLGHGTDRALVAGALGMREDDDRLPMSFGVAAERGLEYSFSEEEMRDVHENTVRMVFHMKRGGTQTVVGSSIGGGQIVITSINGFDVEYTAQSNALVISQYDRKGVISNVAGVLAQHDINIGVMRLSRRARGDVACTIIEVDAHVSPEIVTRLQCVPDVISVRAINVQ
jgi:L-serine dehydratase